MKIIAVREGIDDTISAYLIEIQSIGELPYGIVIDLEVPDPKKAVSLPLPVDSILARGYWEEFKGDQSKLDDLKKTYTIPTVVSAPDSQRENE